VPTLADSAPLDCSVFGATEAIGDAWAWLILSDAIVSGTQRFDAFQRRLGIARSTLSGRLLALCTNGLMTQSGRDYTLTDAGKDFLACMTTAVAWGDRWHADGITVPLQIGHAGCSDRIRGELRCTACTELIDARDVSFDRRPEAINPSGDALQRHRAPALELLQRGGQSSIAATLQVIGDRWSALIIRELFYGSSRFDEFQRRLGIATNILSTRLQRLVEHGIVDKREYQIRPPRHEYQLTPKGLDLYPVPLSMMAWGDRWLTNGPPPVVLSHIPCGNQLVPRLSCSECRRVIVRAELLFVRNSGPTSSAP
jgi:DNA-binding HxlR family transcriptional regulator